MGFCCLLDGLQIRWIFAWVVHCRFCGVVGLGDEMDDFKGKGESCWMNDP